MDAVDREEARALGAEAEEHGVVVLAEVLEAADRGAGVDRDAEHPDLVDLLVEQVGRHAVGRDAVAQHPAGLLLRLEDLDLVTVGAQVVGRGETGRPGADDADPLARVGRQLGLRVAAVGEAVLGRLGLQRPDEDGAVAAAAHAGGFARRRADQAAGQRQRVVAPDDLDRGAIVAVAEVGHEARDVDVGRTRAVAGRRVAHQAEPLGAGLAPHVLLPLLAVVAQGAAERPGRRQPLRGELERHLVEGGEMAGLAAAEGDLGRQARGARQQRAHRRGLLAVGEEPVTVERTPGLLDDAHALGHHHQAGRRRDDAGERERQRIARQVRLGRAAGSRPGRRRRRARRPDLPPRRRRPRRRSGSAGCRTVRARPGRAASCRAGA